MAEEKGEVKEAMSFSKWWSRGFIMNLTNSKVIIFFLAFFPQFLLPGENTEVQILMMGLTFIVATVIVFGAIACFAEFVREKISSARVQQIINRTGAVIFMGLAVSLVFSVWFRSGKNELPLDKEQIEKKEEFASSQLPLNAVCLPPQSNFLFINFQQNKSYKDS